ncbi:YciI family protein [Rhodococcus sp. T7]|uniref:YciI family protein n=1 Tax=Rhodococcus sp. T7 TaxID=627444 RepID=UPI00135750E3|nr:YciI family protein [Rhodococcus sp. T7]KAF0962496.1 hypothetical protein MLGJGCBP_04379 [Rhodococcus sp. T7]
MPLFVVDYTYSADTASGRDTHRSAHRAWLAGLVDDQTVIACGPYADDSGAFILVESDTSEAVARLFALDPFVVHELVPEHRIVHWTPVMGRLCARDDDLPSESSVGAP